jgi:hypothetical protein
MATAPVSKAERGRRALTWDPADRVSISLWAHTFARENTAEDLAEETVLQFRR